MTSPVTPLPIPHPAIATGVGIVLAGGTFDPPHRGHVELAALARDRVAGADAWLVFVPAARSPFKGRGPIAPDADRVEMLRLAVASIPRAAVWTDEIDRAAAAELPHSDPSYFVDTVRRARRLAPRSTLRFIIGADQAAEFHRWRDAPGILDEAEPIVLLRAPLGTRSELRDAVGATGAWSDDEARWWTERAIEAPLMDVSATEIRARLASGTIDEQWLAQQVGTTVASYILRRSLIAT